MFDILRIRCVLEMLVNLSFQFKMYFRIYLQF